MTDKLRLAVFLSGGGSNFEAIAKNCATGAIPCEVVVVVSNVPDAYGLVRAKKYGLPTIACDHRLFASRAEHEAALQRELAPYQFDFIVLAGWMRLLTGPFIEARYNHRFGLPGIVNIHPADTKQYQGAHGYEFAMGLTKKGPRLTETKITVHFIDAGMDTGPVIAERVIPIRPDDNIDTLRERGLTAEWELYSQVLAQLARGQVRLENGRVRIEA